MKTALITGANRGIGLEAARGLVSSGVHVYLGVRDQAEGEKTATELAPLGRVSVLAVDVSDEASVNRAAEAFGREANHLDVLVNNAGVMLDRNGNVLKLTDDIFKATFRTNVLGPLRMVRAFAPYLKRAAAPRIINVSSGGGQLTDEVSTWAPAYCMSKTALNMLTKQLSSALPEAAVNSMCPDWCRTRMGGEGAYRTAEQGADTIIWLATEAPQSQTGLFFRDREVIEW